MSEIVLLNRQKAARFLHIAVPTLDRLISMGQGPAQTRLGGKVLYQPHHLRAWIDSRVVPAGTGTGMTKPRA